MAHGYLYTAHSWYTYRIYTGCSRCKYGTAGACVQHLIVWLLEYTWTKSQQCKWLHNIKWPLSSKSIQPIGSSKCRTGNLTAPGQLLRRKNMPWLTSRVQKRRITARSHPAEGWFHRLPESQWQLAAIRWCWGRSLHRSSCSVERVLQRAHAYGTWSQQFSEHARTDTTVIGVLVAKEGSWASWKCTRPTVLVGHSASNTM